MNAETILWAKCLNIFTSLLSILGHYPSLVVWMLQLLTDMTWMLDGIIFHEQ